MPTLLEQIDRLPPFIAYYAAHFNRERRPTVDELIAESGLASRTFMRHCWKTSWRGTRIEVASAIAKSCRVDLFNPEPTLERFVKEWRKEKPFMQFSDGKNRRVRMLKSLNRFASRAVLELR